MTSQRPGLKRHSCGVSLPAPLRQHAPAARNRSVFRSTASRCISNVIPHHLASYPMASRYDVDSSVAGLVLIVPASAAATRVPPWRGAEAAAAVGRLPNVLSPADASRRTHISRRPSNDLGGRARQVRSTVWCCHLCLAATHPRLLSVSASRGSVFGDIF